jgi:hypothetical protein
LRLQEYIELCRKRDTVGAILYSRKNLSPWATSHMIEIQQGMTLLAFGEMTGVSLYRVCDSYAPHATADPVGRSYTRRRDGQMFPKDFEKRFSHYTLYLLNLYFHWPYRLVYHPFDYHLASSIPCPLAPYLIVYPSHLRLSPSSLPLHPYTRPNSWYQRHLQSFPPPKSAISTARLAIPISKS